MSGFGASKVVGTSSAASELSNSGKRGRASNAVNTAPGIRPGGPTPSRNPAPKYLAPSSSGASLLGRRLGCKILEHIRSIKLTAPLGKGLRRIGFHFVLARFEIKAVRPQRYKEQDDRRLCLGPGLFRILMRSFQCPTVIAIRLSFLVPGDKWLAVSSPCFEPRLRRPV